ncbi:uncharacterized protein LOC125233602 [Leguminivora glycinivorella]|uniref:uncharacterized protein LOC125233602 n=1 Tax=Leguminivora glycinivorella TaxID=1035111 RepID=UPI00200E559C|nr:uncharacterized protein LOC125233602 [Leguminivora glycinivorella]
MWKLVFVISLVLSAAMSQYSQDSCGGDPNAEPGCGWNCGRKCADVKVKVYCPRIYCPTTCQCKPGFYYNDQTSSCVAPQDCPPNSNE